MLRLILISLLFLFIYGCNQVTEPNKVIEKRITITYVSTEDNGANKWSIKNQSDNYIQSVILTLNDTLLISISLIEIGPFSTREERMLYCNKSIIPTIK